jgi:hypothetical protein
MRAKKGDGDPACVDWLLKVALARRFASDRITLTVKARPFLLRPGLFSRDAESPESALEILEGVS